MDFLSKKYYIYMILLLYSFVKFLILSELYLPYILLFFIIIFSIDVGKTSYKILICFSLFVNSLSQCQSPQKVWYNQSYYCPKLNVTNLLSLVSLNIINLEWLQNRLIQKQKLAVSLIVELLLHIQVVALGIYKTYL